MKDLSLIWTRMCNSWGADAPSQLCVSVCHRCSYSLPFSESASGSTGHHRLLERVSALRSDLLTAEAHLLDAQSKLEVCVHGACVLARMLAKSVSEYALYSCTRMIRSNLTSYTAYFHSLLNVLRVCRLQKQVTRPKRLVLGLSTRGACLSKWVLPRSLVCALTLRLHTGVMKSDWFK